MSAHKPVFSQDNINSYDRIIASAGGGGHDSGMEAGIARLEEIALSTKEVLVDMKTDIRELRSDQKTDFRLLFGALIGLPLGLAGLMAHGFHWI